MDIKEIAAKYSDYIIEMRRHFHAHPEVSEKEFETSKRIKEELDKMGVKWRSCGLETGVLATIEGAKPGKTILLRGDMDALTVVETTGAPYASNNPGVMHACGHDCHIAMLLTATKILNDMRDELCGTVRLAFQPAEEVATGAKSMIENGALEGVDGCFAMHVWSDTEAGTVSVEPGPRMASAAQFKVDITGVGSHGAAPHQGVDAVVVASALVNNLQTVVSREFDPTQPAVLTVGTVEAGTRWNVVAENAHLEGTARCFDYGIQEEFPKVIERIVSATADTFRAKAKMDWVPLAPPTINNEHMSAVAEQAARKVMGPNAPVRSEKTNGAEDFAFFMEKVPGAMALLGIRNEALGATWPNHSGNFCVDESALLKGAMLYAQVAMDFNAE